MIDPMLFGDFPKATAVPRGCGEREPGASYAECGLSPHGRPLEEFLIDPPLPLPDGLDIVNKPMLWQRILPSGEPALDEWGQPIYDLLIWVGQEHYAYCPDFVEEVRRFGASRRLNPNLDLSLLSRASHMILAHPKVINTLWQSQRPPQECGKGIEGHDGSSLEGKEGELDEWDEDEDREDIDEGREMSESLVLLHPDVPTSEPPSQPGAVLGGPCLFKLWDLIPQEAAQTVIRELDFGGESGDGSEAFPLCLREIGSAIYQYRPTSESADGLIPGLFATLPITGFALIRYQDGSVNAKAKEKMLAGMERHEGNAIPFYESDR